VDHVHNLKIQHISHDSSTFNHSLLTKPFSSSSSI
jgi:hypothetical protein